VRVTTDEPGDEVDRIIEFWRTENPDLDVLLKGLAMRIRRAAQNLERSTRQNLAVSGVDEFWEIEVLLSLKRAPGNCRRAGDLLRESQVTSGAITNRIDRLEQRGWVRRDVDPADRRQVLVSLTPDGLAQADHVIAAKTQTEREAFSGIDRSMLEQLNDLLRVVVASMESPEPRPT
jgi:DNA-binding MarR family transcriptional regulator